MLGSIQMLFSLVQTVTFIFLFIHCGVFVLIENIHFCTCSLSF